MRRFIKKILIIFATSSGLAVLFVGIFFLSFYMDQLDAASTSKHEEAINRELLHQDVAYCNTTNPSQTLDVYSIDTPSPTPAVIYIHGGGWNQGDKQNNISKTYSPDFIQRDIAFISTNYRLSEEAPYPAQNNDVACAVDYVIANAKALNIDTERLMIMGDSAGGQLASLEALDRKHLYNAAIITYGVSNVWEQITGYHDTNAVAYLGGQSRIKATMASPQSADLKNSPPFLLVHGTSDTVVPASESKDFAVKLQDAGSTALYIPISGAPHGFLGDQDHYDQQASASIFGFVDAKW